MLHKWAYVLGYEDINVYLASSIENKCMINLIADYLEFKFPRVNIISSWYKEKEPATNRMVVDIHNGVLKSDLVVCFAPWGRSGTLQEMAYAVAKDIPSILVMRNNAKYQPLVVDDFMFIKKTIVEDFEKYMDDKFRENYYMFEKTAKTKNYIYHSLTTKCDKCISEGYTYSGGIVIEDISLLYDVFEPGLKLND